MERLRAQHEEKEKERRKLLDRIDGRKWKKAPRGGSWFCLEEDEAVEFEVDDDFECCEMTGRKQVQVARQCFELWNWRLENVWRKR